VPDDSPLPPLAVETVQFNVTLLSAFKVPLKLVTALGRTFDAFTFAEQLLAHE
jgi:hypothetical protein